MSTTTVNISPPSLAVPESNTNLLGIGEYQGKKVFHWSFYLQAAGALGGVIIAIAGIVLAMPALLAPGILFFASNAIGAYYVHTFSVYSQLDTYVDELQEKLTAAQADLIKQKDINQQLDALQKKTEKDIKALQEADKKSLADWAEREKALKSNVEDLEKAVARVEKDRKDALADFDKRFKDLHAEYIVLETNKKAVDAQLIILKQEVSTLSDTNKDLNRELEEFKINYAKYDKENDELREINAELQKQIKNLTEQIKMVPTLDSKPIVKELDETEVAANKAVDKADDLIKKLEEVLKS